MRQTQNLLKLPAKLVQELGGDDILSGPGRRKSRSNSSSRKESRKAERSQKKSLRSGPPPQKRPKTQHTEHPTAEYTNTNPTLQRDAPPPVGQFSPMSKPKSILKRTKKPDPAPDGERSISPPPSIPRAMKHKLEEDDAEIAALEKRLGIKGKKKHLKDDEFAELLGGLGEDTDSDTQQKKISRVEGDEWLDRKRNEARRRAQGMGNQIVEENSGLSEEDLDEDDAATEDEEDEASGMSLGGPEFSDDGSDGGFDELQDDQEEFNDFDESNSDEDSDQKPAPRVRENPYIAPTTRGEAAAAKYIPPSLRKPASSNSEALLRLRRQMQGLVNRLTEANLVSILSDIEKIYRDNARQHVTSTLVDLLLTQVCEPTSLPDTSIIVPAGFISAVYKIIGTDFGAQVIQKIVELFDEHYSHATAASKDSSAAPTSDSSKETSNLITLLSQLYNFQVVGSNLMFDYARLLLEKLSELNTELLLKLVRVSGPQLRQDDPSALKGIVTMLRQAVSKVGEENISVRTSYMIETIDDLKNNRMKTGAAASAVTSEHTIRMKKTLGTLNSRTIKGSEPLRIGLQDIQDSDKKGRWWLVGASWLGKDAGDAGTSQSETPIERKSTAAIVDTGTSDLVQLASEQRMNTDIRRAIFITIMSASDYQDAYLRLMKLKLKRVQELEIPKVLIRCAGGEQSYNPYYTLIAQRICGDRKLKMAFQFGLWDLFKKMGETGEDINDQGDDEEDVLDARRLVNLAKMFGTLIVEGGLGLSVLKNLSLSYLQPKTKTFLEVLFITILLRSQRQSKTKRDDQAILNIFAKAKDTPQLITGLQYFLKKVVAETDIAGGKVEKATVKWACKVALKSLEAIVAMDHAED